MIYEIGKLQKILSKYIFAGSSTSSNSESESSTIDETKDKKDDEIKENTTHETNSEKETGREESTFAEESGEFSKLFNFSINLNSYSDVLNGCNIWNCFHLYFFKNRKFKKDLLWA